MLAAVEIESVLAGGYELRGFEVKGAGARTDAQLLARVAKAALSMANLRDGGHIVIGIDNKNHAAMVPGLSDAELASWLDYDAVATKLAEYSDPPLRMDIAAVDLPSGSKVAVLQIHEFDDVPVLCKRDYPGVLRKGACYVRSRRMPETAEIPTSVEMRELLDLATEKSLRVFVETTVRAGLVLTPGQSPTKPSVRSAVAAYRAQRRRKDVW